MVKRNNRKKLLILIGLISILGVGIAVLTTSISIQGTSIFNRNTWDVHFENLVLDSDNNVEGTQAITSNTTINYSVSLAKPGDKYSFVVDVVNEGTIDAMINTISKSNLSADQAKLIDYKVTYADGVELSQKDKLGKTTGSETIKVSLNYKEDVTASDLPSSAINLNLTFSLIYVQADNTAQNVIHPVSFSADSWDTIAQAVRTGKTENYHVGDTKTVNMGTLGTHTVRIANMSTPSECSGSDFSQTACGFVVEFEDIITLHNMNSTDTNVGEWPASEMRTYVNNDIYNALPSNLQSAIISTKVVSGHGDNEGETNFTSTDKLYLLSTHEVWSDNTNYDTAYNNTRQLDYYANLGVTTSSYSGAIKQYNGSNANWWLRTANSRHADSFFYVGNAGVWYNGTATYARGVSPAFRLG